MNNFVVYPAVFLCHESGVAVSFPDFKGCISCGENINDAVYWARDALSLRLYSDECDHIPFPKPSDPLLLKNSLCENQFVTLIDVDMNLVRAKLGGKTISKMVSMPQWMIAEGKSRGINFSQVLQEALLEKLGAKR